MTKRKMDRAATAHRAVQVSLPASRPLGDRMWATPVGNGKATCHLQRFELARAAGEGSAAARYSQTRTGATRRRN